MTRRIGAAIIIAMILACGAPDGDGTQNRPLKAREKARCATVGAMATDAVTGDDLICVRTTGLTPRWEKM